MPSEEGYNERPLAEEIPRVYLYVILIKQVETGGMGQHATLSVQFPQP